MTQTTPDTPAALAALAAALPESALADPAQPRALIDGRTPDAAARPRSDADVQTILALAHEHELAVAPIGGATMTALGMPPERYDLALDLSALTGVVAYEPDDFTITVEAGMPLAALQRQLAEHGQFVPLDQAQFERATVGGIAAVGRGGLRRRAFGYPRDWVIGMRMIRADGTPIKGGGRVVKNVSGYDLPKLFCGSLGTLGVIVELTFKLRPLPTSDQMAILAADDFAAALEAGRAAMRAEPSLQAAVALSADAAGELDGQFADGQAAIALRMSGLEQAVVESLTRATAAARATGAMGGATGGAATDQGVIETWQAIFDLELATPADQLRLRLGVPPASLADAVRHLRANVPGAARWIAAADSGLLFVDAPCAELETAAQGIEAARAALAPLGGNLTVEQAPPELKQRVDIWGPAGEGARLMHRVKQEFDPQRTLNPGRFVDGI